MNDFLGIVQRLESIKASLPQEPADTDPDGTAEYVQLAPGDESEMAPEHDEPAVVQEEIVRPLQLEDVCACTFVINLFILLQLMTEDDAESKYHDLLRHAQTTLLPFDGDDLGKEILCIWLQGMTL